jgi:hypothetical protein
MKNEAHARIKINQLLSEAGWRFFDQDIRRIIEAKDFHALQTNPTLSIAQYKEVANKYREVIPMYIKDYVKLEPFAA